MNDFPLDQHIIAKEFPSKRGHHTFRARRITIENGVLHVHWEITKNSDGQYVDIGSWPLSSWNRACKRRMK